MVKTRPVMISLAEDAADIVEQLKEKSPDALSAWLSTAIFLQHEIWTNARGCDDEEE